MSAVREFAVDLLPDGDWHTLSLRFMKEGDVAYIDGFSVVNVRDAALIYKEQH